MRKQAVGSESEIRGIALLFLPLKHPLRIGRREKQESRFCRFAALTTWSYGNALLAPDSLSGGGSSLVSLMLCLRYCYCGAVSKNLQGEVACPSTTVTQIISIPHTSCLKQVMWK